MSATDAHEGHFRSFFAIYLVVLVVCIVWGLSTPPFAAPDEPAHVIKAVAIDHGQLIGKSQAATDPNTIVSVPLTYQSSLGVPGCFVHDRSANPACSPPLSPNKTPTETTIQVGRYPPLYYAVVGIPSLLLTSLSGLYAMRLMSAMLAAGFLALAIVVAVRFSRRRVLLVGVLIAITPQVVFFSGVVNPSALEISAAICLWTSGTALVLEHPKHPPRGLVVVTTTAAAVEVLTRGLSPVWVAVTGVAFALAAGVRRSESLLRLRRVQIGVGIVAACSLAAVAWIVAAHALDVQLARPRPRPVSVTTALFGIFERQGRWLRQEIGEFDWENTPAPLFTYLVWCCSIAVFLLGAFVRSLRRQRVVLVTIGIVAILLPVGIVLSQYEHLHGIVWQGKDGAPIVMGVPILAAGLIGLTPRRRLDRAIGTALVSSLIAAQITTFAIVLSRYTNGSGQPFRFFVGATWQPPIHALPLLCLFVLALAALVVAISRLNRRLEARVRLAVGSRSLDPSPDICEPLGKEPSLG